MNKEELINNCISVLGAEQDKARMDLLVQSALAFVNAYTFQNYDFEAQQIPHEIFYALIDLVKVKTTQKLGINSERLSDYAITYSNEEIPHAVKVILDKYRIINVV